MRWSLSRLLVPCLALALAAPAAEQPPMMQLTVADGARLIQRWEAGIYAKLWNDRALDAARARFAEQLAKAEGEAGFKFLDLLAALRFLDLRVEHLASPAAGAAGAPAPSMLVQAELGDFAARLMTLMREKNADDSVAANVEGADEALRAKPKEGRSHDLTMARFGSRLVLGANREQPPAPYAVAAGESDASFILDYRAFMTEAAKAAEDPQQQQAFAAIMQLDEYLAPLHWQMSLVPEGLHERISQAVQYPGMKPVDRSLFSRLPANTLMALAIGFDSKAYWTVLEPVLLDAATRQGQAMTREQLAAQVQKSLGDLGITLGFDDLTAAITGTVLLAITPSAPFPGVTLALPRSKAMDEGMRFAAASQQWELPADGASSILPIPNLPLPVTLIADPGYWVITSDQTMAGSWNAGGAGWSASPAAKLALEKAPASAHIIGASDTGAVLRTAGGFLPLIPFSDPKDKQTVTVLLARAAAAAATGYLVGAQKGPRWELEARGLLGFGFIPVMASAIAIPSLMQSRQAANESAVVSSLKSGVFPAQIQFQGGGYVDQDGDNTGEFGFLAELAGGPISGQPDSVTVNLLPEGWNAVHPQLNGYHFSCWLPDGAGGAIGASDGRREPRKAAAKAQSERFVVYAWPADGSEKRVFALTHTGTIYAATGVEVGEDGPAWNALFDGAGWETAPAWEPYKRR
jgi:hypothetical protein